MATPAGSPSPLVGVWQLLSITAIDPQGDVETPFGPHPVGSLTYSADGHMTVIFAQGNRPGLSGGPSSPFALGAVPAAELAQAFATVSAYAGTYTIAGNSVYHHLTVATLPDRAGTTLVRHFQLEHQRLTLTTPSSGETGPVTVYQLVWERAPAQTPNP